MLRVILTIALVFMNHAKLVPEMKLSENEGLPCGAKPKAAVGEAEMAVVPQLKSPVHASSSSKGTNDGLKIQTAFTAEEATSRRSGLRG